MHEPIGEARIMYFLWDYHNWDITEFEVEKMSVLSNLRRCMGEKGVMEEFLEAQGIPTYTKSNNKLINNHTQDRLK